MDFANASLGRGPADVARLLVLNMDPAERAASEHSLMAQYYEHVTEGGVTMYSMYDAWEDYKRAAAQLMCLAVNVGGVQGLQARGRGGRWALRAGPLPGLGLTAPRASSRRPRPQGEGEELARVIVRRVTAAVREVDGCESLL